MERYDVFLYNIPRVGPDDKPIPTNPCQTKDFETLEEAQKCAADNKGKFDRVVLIGTQDEKQRMLERYQDGTHEVREYKESEQEEESAAGESASA